MQRVEGDTLEARLERGPLAVGETVKLGIEVADALAEVHALGIVHRDLKPSNVILSPRGARVLDFGVASVKGSPKLTTTGVSVGTPLAMAPEQMRGQPPDNRTDLWALGVMLYRAATGADAVHGHERGAGDARRAQHAAQAAERAPGRHPARAGLHRHEAAAEGRRASLRARRGAAGRPPELRGRALGRLGCHGASR
jgi:serine/threonine-protein kinase